MYKNKFSLSLLVIAGFSLVTFADEPVSEDALMDEVVETSAPVSDAPETTSVTGSNLKQDEVELSKVSVTGSRIKRSQTEGPQPLVVMTAEMIEKGGFISVYDAVASAAANTGDFQGDIASGGFTPGANTISLRDFGPGNTLVLVNGKRRADYPFPYSGNEGVFNWNSIPLAMVERIEILSSGASAIYGSDAVAGVINVILISGLEETSVRVRAGAHVPGNGENLNIEFTGGGYIDKFSYAYGLEFAAQEPIYGADRSEYDSYQDDKDPTYRDPDWSIIAIDLFGGPNRLPSAFGGDTCENIGGYTTMTEGAVTDGGGGYPYCGFDGISRKSVRNHRESNSAYVTFNYELNDNIELYADYSYWSQESDGVYFPMFYFDYFYGYAVNNAGDNLGVEGLIVQRIWSDYNWDRSWEDETNSWSFGATGNIEVGNNIWEWDITATNDEYDLTESSQFVTTAGIKEWMCGAQGDSPYCQQDLFLGGYFGLFNPDVWFESTDSSAANLLATAGADAAYFGSSGSESVQASITGELFTLPAGPVAFALVVEDHTQNFFQDATDNIVAGEIQYADAAVGGGYRDRQSWGVEVNLPITSKLQIGLATREDDYDDRSTAIGARRTDQINFQFRPNEDILIRGSWGESFKAPSLPYVHKGLTTAISSPCDYWGLYLNTGDVNGNCAGYNQINTPILSQGSKLLREEQGENYVLGMVVDLVSETNVSWDFSLDLFELTLNDVTSNTNAVTNLYEEAICRIQAVGGNDGGYSALTDAYCSDLYATIVRGDEYRPSNGNNPDIVPPEGGITSVSVTPLNKSTLYYRGADISTTARFLTDNKGDFSLSFSMSYVDDEKRANEVGEEPFSLWDGGYNYRLRTKSYLSFGWSKGDWNTGINVQRWGHMEGNDGKKSPYFDTGVYAAYSIGGSRDHYIQMNVNNLLDAFPDKDGTLAWPYVQDALYPVVGTEVTVSYRYTF
jgi:outer membrane receptor protein involved in Fe transport